eukprot:3447604-Karenia_brevis.AAC.1
MEQFLSKWHIQPHVRDHLKSLTPLLQAQIMTRSLAGVSNPSAALMARVKKAAASDAQPYHVQNFIQTYGISGDVARWLQTLSSEEQQACMSTSLTSAGDKTAALRFRMRGLLRN